MQKKRTETMTGIGLILSRYPGEKIMIKAMADASDEEIIKAMRGDGITLTVVDISDYKNPASNRERKMAKIGINAPKSISILREEILKKEINKSLGN